MTSKKIVSIITPCYNAADYIADAIESVLSQTYPYWEMIIVDDSSTDASFSLLSQYQMKDKRIKIFKTSKNSKSASTPRNLGIEKAQGHYIAFLDSDDIWLPTKLEKQVALAEKKDAAVIYSYYEKINEKGERENRVIKSPSIVNYNQLLKGNVIGCLTAMYSVDKLGKVYFKPVGHEDFVLWLEILKKGYVAYNIPEVLALYRVSNFSMSSNKLKAFIWTWNIYINIEKFSVLKSVYFFIQYVIKAFVKYFK